MERWLGIGSVARQSGLTPDTLRKWESRHGFPRPKRSDGGTRRYSPAILDQLIEIQRLISQGQRPAAAITQITAQPRKTAADEARRPFSRNTFRLDWRSEADLAELVQRLEQQLDSTDPVSFLEQIAAPLMMEAGEAWARGELRIYAERGLSTAMQRLVGLTRQRIAPAPPHAPRVLLVTRPVEQHLLGPAMAACLIQAAGAHCIDGGIGLPTSEVPFAVTAWRAQAIAVSASRAGSARALGEFLSQLRQGNPKTPLWLGGQGAVLLPKTPENCRQLSSFEDIQKALNDLPTAAPRRQ
jgi:DNA-binding transcriptional MerR regulator/methylmalonyl-CoA mutase cobalamin-binding subunit